MLNRIQLEYALKRLDKALLNKLVPIRNKHTVAAKIIDGNGIVKAVKNGKLKLNPKYATMAISRYTDFGEIFSNFRDFNVDAVYDQKAADKEAEPLVAEAEKIKDQLVLGDAPAALKLIEAFEKS